MNIKLFLLNLITFGYYSKKLKKIAKEKALLTTDKLEFSDNVSFDILELIEALGSKKNIISIKAFINKVFVYIKDKSAVSIEKIIKLGCSGTMLSESKIIMIFNEQSEAIAKKVNNELTTI